ncbi:ead/Ea22-like family protein [Citrobacter freundii]|nr:ead/Ea22-like family protein [Citrobacter sp. Cf123]ELR9580295.1 ead/Ea22-like family protein [Citrobacter freundii]MBJ8798660.1 ead/Ea22-like family protein [Citrobacter freundii]MDM3133323.1 ead/Ea22-like family protein [Citrobacter sp. Cf123]HCD8984478.1 ead/Ea22-like family protein [Citrobacter freundii]HEE9984998.1 ead/Ea22-like family protein [Citrobacter freundii]
MTDIQALREELSNPAIGSNAHLRKIALSLLDDLEKEKGYSSAYEAEKWHYHGLAESEGERADRAEKRIEEEICRANREHHRGFMMACNHLKEHANVHYADAAEMEIAALRQRIAELERYRAAFTEQNDKTEWVQHDKRFAVVRPLGKHRADVLREYIEHLEAREFKVEMPESFYPDGDIDAPLAVDELEVIAAIVEAGGKPVAFCKRCDREIDLTHRPDGSHYCHAPDAGIVVKGD